MRLTSLRLDVTVDDVTTEARKGDRPVRSVCVRHHIQALFGTCVPPDRQTVQWEVKIVRISKSTLALIAVAVIVVATFGYAQLRAFARCWDPSSVALALEATTVGDAVTLKLTLSNSGDTEAVFSFASGKQHDFVVLRKTGTQWTKVWQWSDDMMFTEALTEITLAPGETHSLTSTWQSAEAGEYRVVGSIVDRHTTLEAHAAFEIE